MNISDVLDGTLKHHHKTAAEMLREQMERYLAPIHQVQEMQALLRSQLPEYHMLMGHYSPAVLGEPPQAAKKAVKEIAREVAGAPFLLGDYRYVSAKVLVVRQNELSNTWST